MKNIICLLYLFHICTHFNAQNFTKVIKEEYSAWILNSDFNLPAIRFTPFTSSSNDQSKSLGRLSVFNSVGAGISLNNGLFSELVDADNPNNIINTQMRNRFGIHMGMLFSYPNDSSKSFVFAPTVGLQVLDIQFSIGYEMGTVQLGESRTFYTLAYRIPIKKLYNLGYIRMKNREKQQQREGHSPSSS